MNCKEKNYELISEIAAYYDQDVTFKKTYEIAEKFIKSSDFSVNISNVIIVPMKKLSCKMSETMDENLSGTSYKVEISWDVDGDSKEEYESLSLLKDSFKHLIIRAFGDRESFVYSNEDGYRFSMEEDAGVIKCKLSILNKCGIQRIL